MDWMKFNLADIVREVKAFVQTQGVPEKTCLCAQMPNCKVWTLGDMAWRLKETSHKDADGRWVLPTTAEVFDDYHTRRKAPSFTAGI